jgi:hypothetical protein
MALKSGSQEEPQALGAVESLEKQPSDSCSTTPTESPEEVPQEQSQVNFPEPIPAQTMASIWQTCIMLDAFVFEKNVREHPNLKEDALAKYTAGCTTEEVLEEGWLPHFEKVLADFNYHILSGNLSTALANASELRCLLAEFFGCAAVCHTDIYNRYAEETATELQRIVQTPKPDSYPEPKIVVDSLSDDEPITDEALTGILDDAEVSSGN